MFPTYVKPLKKKFSVLIESPVWLYWQLTTIEDKREIVGRVYGVYVWEDTRMSVFNGEEDARHSSYYWLQLPISSGIHDIFVFRKEKVWYKQVSLCRVKDSIISFFYNKNFINGSNSVCTCLLVLNKVLTFNW